MKSTVQARVMHRYIASSERVYDAWLQPEAIHRWMHVALTEMGLAGDIREVQADARVGGSFCFADRRGDTEARHWGKYLELERPRKIVFTWIVDASEEANPSVVTINIEPDGTGCVATLVHEMDAAWREYVSRTEQGWGRMLKAIDVILNSATA